MYQNFKPTVWAVKIETQAEEEFVFAKDTNRSFEGDIKKQGDSVRILGVARPTITELDTKHPKLGAPEHVSDTSTTMLIDKMPSFNYEVGDVDKAQASGKVLEALNHESTLALTDKVDKYIADIARDPLAVRADSSAQSITTANILNYIDTNLAKLYANGVRVNSNLSIVVPPWFYVIFKQAYQTLSTNNVEMLKNGLVAMYGNVKVRMSGNVANDTNGNSLIQLKTDKAIAFANPQTHTEACRPTDGFADVIKGYMLCGTKLVRPKEMIVLNCKRG